MPILIFIHLICLSNKNPYNSMFTFLETIIYIVSLREYNHELVNKLRELKFGVTTYEGEGINKEKRYKLKF